MLIFFFKQKTAYEMRISDWSSDVCSSDLVAEEGGRKERRRQRSAGGRRVVRRRKGSQHARQIIDREGVHIIAILGQVIIGIDAADQEVERSVEVARQYAFDRPAAVILVRPVELQRLIAADLVAAKAAISGFLRQRGDRKSTRLNSSH